MAKAPTAWRCSECGRSFGRPKQSHVCVPVGSLDAWLASRPAGQRAAAKAVLAHLRRVGPIVVEAALVGVLVKRKRTFVEMRPGKDRLALSFVVTDPVTHPRIRRTMRASAHRFAHVVDLHTAADVDDEVRGWLAESYLSSAD